MLKLGLTQVGENAWQIPLDGQPRRCVEVCLRDDAEVDVEVLLQLLDGQVVPEASVHEPPAFCPRDAFGACERRVSAVSDLHLEVLRREERGKGAARRDGRPHQDIGRVDVVQNLGRLVGVGRAHHDVQDLPTPFSRLEERQLAAQLPEPLLEVLDVLQVPVLPVVGQGVREGSELEPGLLLGERLLREKVLQLLAAPRAGNGRDDRPAARSRDDVREALVGRERPQHAQMEGRQAAAPAQQQGRAPVGLEERVNVLDLLGEREVVPVVRHDLPQACDGLSDVVLVPFVAQVPDQVELERILERLDAVLAGISEHLEAVPEQNAVVQEALRMPAQLVVLLLRLVLLDRAGRVAPCRRVLTDAGEGPPNPRRVISGGRWRLRRATEGDGARFARHFSSPPCRCPRSVSPGA
mmetsp:Transcript_11104/g.23242  ORF Transcript_11104/g.23242 Transcript_11104/m.23242 type:complete len:410 (-) Transcript_11104:163-1392(-)